MKKCVFAGTFDPFTVGHQCTTEKCLAMFDEVIVAIAENTSKKFAFTAAERAEMVRAVFSGNPRVRVVVWDKTIADLLEEEGTPFYVRGIRNTVDFEYENADYYASKKINAEMIAIYLPAEQNLLHVSSTLVKNCIAFKKPYEEYVPKAVYQWIEERERHV